MPRTNASGSPAISPERGSAVTVTPYWSANARLSPSL